jgi:hypothetical protein
VVCQDDRFLNHDLVEAGWKLSGPSFRGNCAEFMPIVFSISGQLKRG